jgi:hypothetical protein
LLDLVSFPAYIYVAICTRTIHAWEGGRTVFENKSPSTAQLLDTRPCIYTYACTCTAETSDRSEPVSKTNNPANLFVSAVGRRQPEGTLIVRAHSPDLSHG